MSIDSDGIHAAGLLFYGFALLVIAGGLAGTFCAAWLARRRGYDSEIAWQALGFIVVFGLIGARLWFVIFPPQSVIANGVTTSWYFSHLLEINQGVLAIWKGGFGLIGGIIGGVLGLTLYMRINRLPLLPWLDIAAVSLALTQTIGRLGDGFAQDLYGPPVSWGILVNIQAQRVAPYTDLTLYPLATARFQPVFLYEAIFTAILFIVLLRFFSRNPSPGDTALLYVAIYGVGCVLLEVVRVNVSLVAGINISQVAAGIFAAVAILNLWRCTKLKNSQVQ